MDDLVPMLNVCPFLCRPVVKACKHEYHHIESGVLRITKEVKAIREQMKNTYEEQDQ
jgi:hypothetical protein